MKTLRSIPLGVILSMIYNAETENYDFNYKEILEAAYKAVENKRKRISALKSIIRIV